MLDEWKREWPDETTKDHFLDTVVAILRNSVRSLDACCSSGEPLVEIFRLFGLFGIQSENFAKRSMSLVSKILSSARPPPRRAP